MTDESGGEAQGTIADARAGAAVGLGEQERRRRGPSAFDAALRLLGMRARSVAEIRERLARRDFDEAEIENVIVRLQAHRVLDDREFAQEWVRSRRGNRGAAALRQELARKGIDRELVDEVLDGLGGSQQLDEATVLAAKRIAAASPALLGDPDGRRKLEQRALAALARRGFDSETARDAVARAVADVIADGRP